MSLHLHQSNNYLSVTSEDVLSWLTVPVDLSFPDRPNPIPPPSVHHTSSMLPVAAPRRSNCRGPMLPPATARKKSTGGRDKGHPYDRKFACRFCISRFRERKNLVAHEDEVHKKRRKFSCLHFRCTVTSNRRFNMHRHERLMHRTPCRLSCSRCRAKLQSTNTDTNYRNSNNNSVVERTRHSTHSHSRSNSHSRSHSHSPRSHSYSHSQNSSKNSNNNSNSNHVHTKVDINITPNTIVSQPVSMPSVPDWLEIGTLADVDEVQTLFDAIL